MDNYKPGYENIDDLDEPNLYERAGLTYCGKDEDGLDEWMGTKKQWDRYSELEAEEELGDEPFDTDAGIVGDISDENREGVIL